MRQVYPPYFRLEDNSKLNLCKEFGIVEIGHDLRNIHTDGKELVVKRIKHSLDRMGVVRSPLAIRTFPRLENYLTRKDASIGGGDSVALLRECWWSSSTIDGERGQGFRRAIVLKAIVL
jgi:hypothetical protein